MHSVLRIAQIWMAGDLVFVALWAGLSAKRRRAHVVRMVRAAERYANRANVLSRAS